MPTVEVEKLYTMVLHKILSEAPVLSGNLKSSIHTALAYGNEFVIVIDAPFYSQTDWEKYKAVVPTGKSVNGQTAYAQMLNDVGAFGSRNKSMHWVNRACLDAVSTIASEIGAEVINELEL